MERKGGILLHISSLPGEYGIGTLGKEAYDFVDLLEECGQKLWQILPIGPTGYGDSPYQVFSAFAGNPLFIDLSMFVEEKILKKEELDILFSEKNYIDYGKIYKFKFSLLRKIFNTLKKELDKDYYEFYEKNEFWLDDYSTFMALKKLDERSWIEWNIDFKTKKFDKNLIKEIEDEKFFYCFLQYIFASQWEKLKDYANLKGISIIGDIPIFVAMDSSDVWANPELFELNEELKPKRVAGVPPDYFSETGQLWGNPLYDWENLLETEFNWWINRFKKAFEMFDYVRVDHFRGFCAYWAIPANEKTAINGKWEKAFGLDLFKILRKKFKNLPIIAEDLGIITEDVVELREKFSFPGMKVLQFGFEDGANSEHLPHNYDNSNFVAYTGTHDNDTLKGWFSKLDNSKKDFLLNYLNIKGENIDKNIVFALIREVWKSVAVFAVIPLQDFLVLGSEARMNSPGTVGNNWQWKATKREFESFPVDFLREISKLYKR
ncbi:MAG: 4-alpha-glucanotransferase [Brevinematales bacterium]|nr:4-alpha-glucanotransferase [Brevinematales bacterium]